MPPRIHVLPSELADQIAAGEVVERPASVVKELVENSLDAGARRIDVDVEGGGRRVIRVVDDGGGMTGEEAQLALLRHATSKLSSLDDLFALATMGFRGEALPSIAAVSRFALTTRTPDSVVGTRIEVDGGVVAHGGNPVPAGCPAGTQVEVRDLLYNVPARLKFLKAEPTEAAKITEAVTNLALAHPEVHFRLRHAGRVALDFPPHASLLERVRAVVGGRLAGRLFAAEHAESGVRVRVFLAAPDEAQTTARGVQLFCGRRAMRDRGLLHAVVMGYGELIPHGRYPTAVVFVDPPAGSVDVNVHPQKIEVRFARPQEIFAAVRHAVGSALARAPWLAERSAAAPAPVSMYAVTAMGPPAAHLSDMASDYGDRQERLLTGFQGYKAPSMSAHGGSAPYRARAGSEGSEHGLRPEIGFFGGLTYLGQLELTYLVCAAPGELVLVDQHAAHERIAFQRLRAAHEATGVRTQRLLFPRTVELQAAQAAAAGEHRVALESIGFELEPFGAARWALKASPAELREEEVLPALTDLLSELADADASRAVGDRIDHMLATVACHSVVRAGDPLSPDEAIALLSALDGVDFRGHCPHGRPVLLRLGVGEIARRFGRT